jgi:hypothetical protein
MQQIISAALVRKNQGTVRVTEAREIRNKRASAILTAG